MHCPAHPDFPFPLSTHLQRCVAQHLLELDVTDGMTLQQLINDLVEHLGLLACMTAHPGGVIHHNGTESDSQGKGAAAKAILEGDCSCDACTERRV